MHRPYVMIKGPPWDKNEQTKHKPEGQNKHETLNRNTEVTSKLQENMSEEDTEQVLIQMKPI